MRLRCALAFMADSRGSTMTSNSCSIRSIQVIDHRISATLEPMTALDEILATIRQLPLPERLRLIERATLEVAQDNTPKPAAVAKHGRTLSVDEFMAVRLTPPPGVGHVSLQDMDRAIAAGPAGRGSV